MDMKTHNELSKQYRAMAWDCTSYGNHNSEIVEMHLELLKRNMEDGRFNDALMNLNIAGRQLALMEWIAGQEPVECEHTNKEFIEDDYGIPTSKMQCEDCGEVFHSGILA